MITKIIISIYLSLWGISIVLLLPQLIDDNRITNILSKIGLIILLVIGVITLFFTIVMCFYKLWG